MDGILGVAPPCEILPENILAGGECGEAGSPDVRGRWKVATGAVEAVAGGPGGGCGGFTYGV